MCRFANLSTTAGSAYVFADGVCGWAAGLVFLEGGFRSIIDDCGARGVNHIAYLTTTGRPYGRHAGGACLLVVTHMAYLTAR